MQVYTITGVINSYENVFNYGAADVWHEAFADKKAAIKLLEEWGCKPLCHNGEELFYKEKEKNGTKFKFYYKINTQYFVGAAS